MLKVYLTDLQAYNEGHWGGKWIELPLTSFELSHTISEVLNEGETVCKTEDHEEYFITDYEWEEEQVLDVEEYANLFELNDQVQKLSELQPYQLKAVRFLLDQGISLDIDDAIASSDEVIIHEGQEMEDVAYNLIQESYNLDNIPALIANHIDYEGIARDLEYEGCYREYDGDIYEYHY
ncbi:antirestriction protein ArdA [Hydrogenimonas cancrithermarum]|uniref:Antirestriction protein ArdA n=1 Tax=Hydrogenimonas cancrithermarum TaxID=2993563 RepID=A0ABN6WU50_9BACT|nr:antirestriction protein ArdA [Hydrogenimonas cancrithermarum]BDY12391.1 hypothetical protein HCR_07030 [Hydrogenimonas cancrithermarum]